jgi:ATP phosphoribosyltransferase regulatory subunit
VIKWKEKKMAKWKLYTPDGFQDILFDECFVKRKLENDMRKKFSSMGYCEIETPMLEFFDTFSMDEEFSPQESAFKLFDTKGRIMVLRPDMTIPVARLMATKLKDIKLPARVSYIGNTLRMDELGGGKQYEYTQAGIELIGESNEEADAEVIYMAAQTLLNAGLKDFQIEIGQADFFKGLLDELGLNEKDKISMRKLVDKKDYLGIEEIISRYNISKELSDFTKTLPDQFGDMQLIEKVKKIVKNERSLKALDNLVSIYNILKDYSIEKYISIDLGLVRSLMYYTGIVFRGFTYGIGFPIISGGRYDELLGKFGKKMPATGFSVGINLLMKALEAQKIESERQNTDTIAGYEQGMAGTAIKIAEVLRKQGLNVVLDIEKLSKEQLKLAAKERGIGGIVWIKDNENIIVCDLEKGTETAKNLNALAGGME